MRPVSAINVELHNRNANYLSRSLNIRETANSADSSIAAALDLHSLVVCYDCARCHSICYWQNFQTKHLPTLAQVVTVGRTEHLIKMIRISQQSTYLSIGGGKTVSHARQSKNTKTKSQYSEAFGNACFCAECVFVSEQTRPFCLFFSLRSLCALLGNRRAGEEELDNFGHYEILSKYNNASALSRSLRPISVSWIACYLVFILAAFVCNL